MIIDAILDRKASGVYTQQELDYILAEADIFEFEDILKAFERNNNMYIQFALCDYIDSGGYNPEIKNYVNRADWTVNGFTS